MAKKKQQGHYCRICQTVRSNESFSGKGHAKHICKKCQSLPKEVRADRQRNNEIALSSSIEDREFFDENLHADNEITLDDDDFEYDELPFDYQGIDRIPIFPEKKSFKKLDQEYKAVLREYVRRKTADHIATYGKAPKEHELIEIRKQMIRLFEEEYHITLKSDPILRQFFSDNAAAVINKLSKKEADNGSVF